jgi:hypothetical protein
MPYKIIRRKSCYRVINKNTKRVHSKCSTKNNAKKQYRLLNAIDHNPNFKYQKIEK